MRAGRSSSQDSCQHGVDFYIGFIEQLVGATGSRPFGNSGIPTTRFILDQSGKADKHESKFFLTGKMNAGKLKKMTLNKEQVSYDK